MYYIQHATDGQDPPHLPRAKLFIRKLLASPAFKISAKSRLFVCRKIVGFSHLKRLSVALLFLCDLPHNPNLSTKNLWLSFVALSLRSEVDHGTTYRDVIALRASLVI
jgi:hypothetical protein